MPHDPDSGEQVTANLAKISLVTQSARVWRIDFIGNDGLQVEPVYPVGRIRLGPAVLIEYVRIMRDEQMRENGRAPRPFLEIGGDTVQNRWHGERAEFDSRDVRHSPEDREQARVVEETIEDKPQLGRGA